MIEAAKIKIEYVRTAGSTRALAPSLRLLSFAQTTSPATRPQPADVSNPQSVPACTRDRIADHCGDALDAVGHHLRVLDEVGQAVDHAGDQDLIVVERHLA